jgi:predicted transposase YdaD
MSKPFDATMRKLLDLDPAAWLRFLHVPLTDPDRVRVIDSNVSTITADADKVLWVDEQELWIEHFELQAGRDNGLPDSVHHYNSATLWAATKVLMGLRYPKERVEEFERGVSAMILGVRGIEESSVYQDIFAKGEAKGEARGRVEGRVEGRAEEARLTILRQGRKKFGPPDDDIRNAIDSIYDLDQLNGLLDRILDVSTWHDLLAPHAPPV